MNKTTRLFLSIGTMALVFLFTSSRALAVECKTLARNACIQSAQCTWVKGYTRKDGRKVAPYCRKIGSKSHKKSGLSAKKKTGVETKKPKPKGDKKKASKKKDDKKSKKKTKKKESKDKKKK